MRPASLILSASSAICPRRQESRQWSVRPSRCSRSRRNPSARRPDVCSTALERVGNRFPDPVVLFSSRWRSHGSRRASCPATSSVSPIRGPASRCASTTCSAPAAFAVVPVRHGPGVRHLRAAGHGAGDGDRCGRGGTIGSRCRGLARSAGGRVSPAADPAGRCRSDPRSPAVRLGDGHRPSDGRRVVLTSRDGTRSPGSSRDSRRTSARCSPASSRTASTRFWRASRRAARGSLTPAHTVNPLNNYWLSVATAAVVVPVTWWLVERVVEPRLADVSVDGDSAAMPSAHGLTIRERRALWATLAVALMLSGHSPGPCCRPRPPFRAPDGSLTGPGSPLMQALIPLAADPDVAALDRLRHGCRHAPKSPRGRRGHGHDDVVDGLLRGDGVLRGAFTRHSRTPTSAPCSR